MLRKLRGFTLMELMVVLAVVAILAAIAYPSYVQYVVRSNRTAAQAQMMDIANRQQQFLLSQRSYASETALADSGYALPAELSTKYSYSVTVGTATVPSFTITFTPKSTGSQAGDVVMTLNSEGVKTPAGKWK